MRVLPRQIVQAIESLIGPKPTDIDERRLKAHYQSEINSILTLLNDVPTSLVNLPFPDYLELTQCRSALAAAAGGWVVGDVARVVKAVNGKDAVERIRLLMMRCQDEIPPPEPELPFVDDDARPPIQGMMSTAWRNFDSHDWLGATTFGGAAMEAVLLWALKNKRLEVSRKKSLDDQRLPDLIEGARSARLIFEETAMLALQTKEARNFIHAGKVAREGPCTKASALTALAGLYRVIQNLKLSIEVRGAD